MRFATAHIHPPHGLRQTFAALRWPNYRLWFTGQLLSLVGTWMQTTAQGYLVFELTRSPAFLGYVGFAAGLPAWAFTLYGGVIADRLPRRTLLIVTQISMMLLAFILAGLVFTGLVQPWHVILLALGLGVANAFDAPARQAFVAELVGREDLTNAIALNSSLFNSATVVGPAVAGAVYALFGAAWCFTLNGLSFLAVITALLLMKLAPRPPRIRGRSVAAELKQGLIYAASEPLIRTLVLNMVFLSLFGLSMVTLLPAWSVNILGGDVRTNGMLLSARGLGALAGALMVASLGRQLIRGKLWTIGSFLLPAAIALFALARWLPLSLISLVLAGWGFIVVANSSNAMIQTTVPDDLRGRVMSLFTLTFMGAMPLGSLWVGGLAECLGEPAVLMLNVVVLLLTAVFIWLRFPFVRHLA